MSHQSVCSPDLPVKPHLWPLSLRAFWWPCWLQSSLRPKRIGMGIYMLINDKWIDGGQVIDV